ncbi:hypothetical protein HK099_003174, partial [Clydaea vesicula]
INQKKPDPLFLDLQFNSNFLNNNNQLNLSNINLTYEPIIGSIHPPQNSSSFHHLFEFDDALVNSPLINQISSQVCTLLTDNNFNTKSNDEKKNENRSNKPKKLKTNNFNDTTSNEEDEEELEFE